MTRIRHSVLASLFVSCLLAAPAWANDENQPRPLGSCAAELISISGYRLGIGVLAETEGSVMQLGISPYAGSLHGNIVAALLDKFSVNRIVWMGEIRYIVIDGQLSIREANETSGYYAEIAESGFSVAKGPKLIPVSNSVQMLPAAFRTIDFEGFPYSEDHFRLARELQGVKGDVRHSIGNSLQVFLAATKILRRMNDQNAPGFIVQFRRDHSSDLTLIRWLVLNLIEDGRIGMHDMSAVFRILALFSDAKADSSQVREIDLTELHDQIQTLNQFITPGRSGPVVDYYRLN